MSRFALKGYPFRSLPSVHQRPEGTARRNFNANKKHLEEGADYFVLNQANEIRPLGIQRPQGGTPSTVILLTESGYLMLVKSFTDDLAWTVQRELVNAKSRTAKQMMALWTAAGVKPEYQALALGDYYRADGIKLPASLLTQRVCGCYEIYHLKVRVLLSKNKKSPSEEGDPP